MRDPDRPAPRRADLEARLRELETKRDRLQEQIASRGFESVQRPQTTFMDATPAAILRVLDASLKALQPKLICQAAFVLYRLQFRPSSRLDCVRFCCMRLSTAGFVLLAGLSCSTRPADFVDLRTLELSTSFSPQSDTLVAFSGAVEFHNSLARPVTVVLREPCSIIVRAYRLDAVGTAPSWDQARRPGGCKSFPYEFTIAGRSSRRLQFGPIDAAEILNDSLPVTAYRLTVFIAQLGESPLPGAELTVTTAVLKHW